MEMPQGGVIVNANPLDWIVSYQEGERDEKGNFLSLTVVLQFDDGKGGFVQEQHTHPRKEPFDLTKGEDQGKNDETVETLIAAGVLAKPDGPISKAGILAFERKHFEAERAASGQLKAKPLVVSETVMLDEAP